MTLIKLLWHIKRRTKSFLLYSFYKFTQGLLLKKIGKGVRFYGSITFGNLPCNLYLDNYCSIGRNLFVSTTGRAEIHIGKNTSINTGAHIVAVDSIKIGDNTLIAEYVTIRDQNHRFDNQEKLIGEQGFTNAPIEIGNNVWIGRGVHIGPGIKIGDGAIIGANSVVTESVPPNAIAVGIPIKVIKYRN